MSRIDQIWCASLTILVTGIVGSRGAQREVPKYVSLFGRREGWSNYFTLETVPLPCDSGHDVEKTRYSGCCGKWRATCPQTTSFFILSKLLSLPISMAFGGLRTQ